MIEVFNGFGLQAYDANVVENRHVFVGGSDVPTILGINKYKTQYELALEKTGLKEREFTGNPYTQFGNVLEPQIRDYINSMNQTAFKTATFEDKHYGIRSNVDGLDDEEGLLLEIKTHGKRPTLEVYKAQMQLYMHQIGVEEGWLALYERPDDFDVEFDKNRLTIEVVTADEAYQEKILDSIETFWIRCEFLKDNPDMTETEFMSYGTELEKAIVKLNSMTPVILEHKAYLKKLEEHEKQLKDYLYEHMEANDVKKIETPHIIVTRVLPVVTKRFDTKTFKEDYPELHDQYTKESQRKGYIKMTERKD